MADPKTYTEDEYNALVQEKEALKANRDEALTEAKRAKAALKAWDGKDPAKYDQLLAAADEAEQKRARAEGDFESLKKQLTDKHASEREGDAKRIAKFESALSRRLKQDELRKAMVGKVDPTMMELLVEHGSKYIGIRETDDDFEQFVSDGKGNPLVADGKGTPMTVDQFVDQNLKAKFPGAFLGTGSSGGGATRSTGGASGAAGSVSSTNSKDFLANVADIAAGKVTVGS